MDIGTITGIIVAATGLIGAYTAHVLGKRGQRTDEKQQAAATRLQERIAAFDELESLNDRLTKALADSDTERTHLRTLIAEAEDRGDLRLAAQGRRCRERMEDLTAAFATLQSVVVAEMAKSSAADAIDKARSHIAEDHPDHD